MNVSPKGLQGITKMVATETRKVAPALQFVIRNYAGRTAKCPIVTDITVKFKGTDIVVATATAAGKFDQNTAAKEFDRNRNRFTFNEEGRRLAKAAKLL